MLCNQQISFMKEDFFNTLKTLYHIANDDYFKQIFEQAKEIYEKEYFFGYLERNNTCQRNQKIKQRVILYLINGFNQQDIKNLICTEFEIDYVLASDLVNTCIYLFNRTCEPQKIYAAHALKKAGITNKKIAILLHIPCYKVAKFLNMKIDIDD